MKTKKVQIPRFAILLVATFCASNGAFSQSDDHQTKAEQIYSGDHATGNWLGLRDTMLERGIELFGSYTADVWGNLSGGKKRGTVFNGLADFGIHLDLETLLGWRGASLYNNWLWLHGRDPSESLVGDDFFGVSNIAGYNTVRLFELWFQQNFFDDAVSVRLGRLAADQEFAVAEYAGLFLNGTFGFPLALTESLPNGGPQYPLATGGMRLELNPADWLCFRTAVFQGDPFAEKTNPHGMQNWLHADSGVLLLSEADFRWRQIASHSLPGNFKIGAWFHTANFADPQDDNIQRPGNRGAYFILEQKFYTTPRRIDARLQSHGATSVSPAHGGTDSENGAGLGAFARIAFQPPERNSISLYADAGLVYQGLLAARPHDTAGIAIGWGKLSPGAAESLRTAGASHPEYSVVLEASYHIQITPWLCVQPDVQYIIRPGANADTPDTLLLGIRSTLQF